MSFTFYLLIIFLNHALIFFRSQAGARICTSKELSSNVAIDTGCRLNKARVWSATDCDDGEGIVTQAGSSAGLRSNPPACTPESVENVSVRCCADILVS